MILDNDFCTDSKVKEAISKNGQLLQEGKFYEFAVKIKALAHRRTQGKRYSQAEMLLILGVENLIKNQAVQWSVCFDLLQNISDLYLANPQLLTQKSEKKFVELACHRKSEQPKAMGLIKRVAAKSGQLPNHKILARVYVNYILETQEYSKAEPYAAVLSDEEAFNFTQKWCKNEETTEPQIPAIWCRMVLARCILLNLETGCRLFQKLRCIFEGENQFLVFTGLLIKVIKMKSKEGYNLIQNSYKQFLTADPSFNFMYKNIGGKFFGVAKSQGNSSLMSLLQ